MNSYVVCVPSHTILSMYSKAWVLYLITVVGFWTNLVVVISKAHAKRIYNLHKCRYIDIQRERSCYYPTTFELSRFNNRIIS